MPEISLPAFHMTTRTKITVEVSHELAQDLERYKAFYKQAYGADVSDSDILREMARRFMEADQQFQAAKRGIKPRSRARQRTAGTSPAEASQT
jgi:hypothetical protein